MNIQWEYLWKVPSTQYENKLTAQLLSKTHPDILKLNATQYEQLLKKGMLKTRPPRVLMFRAKTVGLLEKQQTLNFSTVKHLAFQFPQRKMQEALLDFLKME